MSDDEEEDDEQFLVEEAPPPPLSVPESDRVGASHVSLNIGRLFGFLFLYFLFPVHRNPLENWTVRRSTVHRQTFLLLLSKHSVPRLPQKLNVSVSVSPGGLVKKILEVKKNHELPHSSLRSKEQVCGRCSLSVSTRGQYGF